MPSLADTFRKAEKHLARRDPVLKRIIKQIGPCTLEPSQDYFGVLVRSIISQQISTLAAKSIFRKVQETFAPTPLQPKLILEASTETLKNAGLSAAKQRYIRDLSEKLESGELVLEGIAELDDEEVITRLLPVKGIGRWTAEMFLIFCLGRLNVLPVADLGVIVGVQKEYELEKKPGKEELLKLAEPWQPYRTIGIWYIWRTFGDVVPQSK
ncbi:MAG: DNA-3-methyladenine glycosylase family protein [Gemmataceae bacterium]